MCLQRRTHACPLGPGKHHTPRATLPKPLPLPEAHSKGFGHGLLLTHTASCGARVLLAGRSLFVRNRPPSCLPDCTHHSCIISP